MGSSNKKPSALEEVLLRLQKRQDVVTADTEGVDYAHVWQKEEGEVTLRDLHDGLVAISSIAEAAVELGVRVAQDLDEVSNKLDALETRVDGIQQPVNEVRRNLQGLRDDLREIDEKTRLIPAIKATLLDIYGRLPD